MKEFIKRKLHEHWGWDDDKVIFSPLAKELDIIEKSGYDIYQIQQALEDLENEYAAKYAEYEGDSYGIIDAMKKVMPSRLSKIYDDMHPNIYNESIETNEFEGANFRFNDGKFNKNGANTIYMDDNPIVDFGVGGIGDIQINGETYPNSLYLKGGYNASEQGKGYGSIGIKVLFQKLPKIQNLILQCFDTACPFWVKQGGQEIATKELDGGHTLRTLRISRDSFE